MEGRRRWPDRGRLRAKSSVRAARWLIGIIAITKGAGELAAGLSTTAAPEAGAGIADSGNIAAWSVRFTQDSIGQTFKGGKGSVLQLGQDLANGDVSASDLRSIRVFEQDGSMYSLDNRRLFAGQMANIDLPYTMAPPSELDAELPLKFTTNNEGTGIMLRGVGYFSWFGQ